MVGCRPRRAVAVGAARTVPGGPGGSCRTCSSPPQMRGRDGRDRGQGARRLALGGQRTSWLTLLTWLRSTPSWPATVTRSARSWSVTTRTSATSSRCCAARPACRCAGALAYRGGPTAQAGLGTLRWLIPPDLLKPERGLSAGRRRATTSTTGMRPPGTRVAAMAPSRAEASGESRKIPSSRGAPEDRPRLAQDPQVVRDRRLTDVTAGGVQGAGLHRPRAGGRWPGGSGRRGPRADGRRDPGRSCACVAWRQHIVRIRY